MGRFAKNLPGLVAHKCVSLNLESLISQAAAGNKRGWSVSEVAGRVGLACRWNVGWSLPKQSLPEGIRGACRWQPIGCETSTPSGADLFETARDCGRLGLEKREPTQPGCGAFEHPGKPGWLTDNLWDLTLTKL